MRDSKNLICKVRNFFAFLVSILIFIFSVYGCTIAPDTSVFILNSPDKQKEYVKSERVVETDSCNSDILSGIKIMLDKQEQLIGKHPTLIDPLACSRATELLLPLDIEMPELPSFSENELDNHILIEDRLISHIAELRILIRDFIDNLIRYQEEYNKQKV